MERERECIYIHTERDQILCFSLTVDLLVNLSLDPNTDREKSRERKLSEIPKTNRLLHRRGISVTLTHKFC